MRRKDTLIVNADGLPLSVLPIKALSWKDAISAVWTGAHVLHNYEDWVVRSPKMEMQVPSVIMLNHMVKWNRYVGFSRRNLFIRDDFRCQYCGDVFKESELTKDHVIPRSHGGPMKWENISTCCVPCNRSRGDNASIRPINQPYRPTYYEIAEKAKRYPITVPDISWGDFIGWDKNLINVKENIRKIS